MAFPLPRRLVRYAALPLVRSSGPSLSCNELGKCQDRGDGIIKQA